MKNTVKIIFFILFVSFSQIFAQADFKFEKTEFDFGTVTEKDDTLWVDFKFKNIGSEPLVISEIKTACECTLADWVKKPVMPGKEGIIKAGYKYKGKSGSYNKTLTIMANTLPAVSQLVIKGVILDKK
ncbi:MAG: DUF1573 domain-containing protein [Bacteroidetes bacterium]|nr:MAG: DUF1573 domain-containing protein [Bacteroidota bacterium]